MSCHNLKSVMRIALTLAVLASGLGTAPAAPQIVDVLDLPVRKWDSV